MCVSYNVLDGTQKRMTRVIINIIISSANTMTGTSVDNGILYRLSLLLLRYAFCSRLSSTDSRPTLAG